MKVENTNDFSIVSKLSSAKKTYFDDEFLQLFVPETKIRAPIINRGYYIRFKAMESVFKSWFLFIKSAPIKKNQIISLGAGFDSSFFRLKKNGDLPMGTKYIEIDYPLVMNEKLKCIKKSSFKIEFSNDFKDDTTVAYSEEYILLSVNLNDLDQLQRSFEAIKIDHSIPTLFISECAMIYMDVKNSNNLLAWIPENFPESAYCAYEQTHAWDSFGIIMRKHFESLGCPLISLLNYSSETEIKARYLEMGWKNCSVFHMNEFFHSLPSTERQRIQSLELFDEYEIWHEKCQHYAIIWASQGEIGFPQLFQIDCKDKPCISISSNKRFKWEIEKSNENLHRYGHQTVLMNSSSFIVSGGFGCFSGHQNRLGGLLFCDMISKVVNSINVVDPKNLLGKRMFHSMNKLSTGDVVILGGRSSPKNVFDQVLSVQFHEREFLESFNFSASVELRNSMPVPSWRHSASTINKDGTEYVMVFGGCSAGKNATNGCFILNTKSWAWSEVSSQENTPSPRHSHSAVTYENSRVIIIGGLSEDETVLNSVHSYDFETNTWSSLHISGLLPRYSHTAHVWNNKIYLIGGVTCTSGVTVGIAIINLATMSAIELLPPEASPESLVLLNNHSSFLDEDKIVIIGGGGNYFSFGTHFNSYVVNINLKSLENL